MRFQIPPACNKCVGLVCFIIFFTLFGDEEQRLDLIVFLFSWYIDPTQV